MTAMTPAEVERAMGPVRAILDEARVRPRVSRASIARKMREGVSEQGWAVYGTEGTWLAAAERVCQHLERKGIEVHR